MTDYGHELIFGGFLTPTAGQPEQVVALAKLCEQVGLDLVTFQDHPYQPGHLDTWTLMSYLAAATSRIRLAGNVLNLPLRQPVVLARSVASLDLLTGGRVELGLGAGAFWEAIEAAGGRRLTPGQAVDALDEAVRVIREVWAADRRGMVRVEGEHYRVVGAKRGPAPAHDVGIWVGAYKPRMLRLVGRVADGWLPSLAYLAKGPGELAELNALVDEGAEAAGREPRSVRRLLNISGRFGRSAGPELSGRATGTVGGGADRARPRPRHVRVHPRRRRPHRDPALRAGGGARRCASWSPPSAPSPAAGPGPSRNGARRSRPAARAPSPSPPPRIRGYG